MNAARRNHKRRDWPRGLYEPRPGYYVWRSLDGRTRAIGKVVLAEALAEAIAANAFEASTKPSLVDRLSGRTNNVASLLKEMPTDAAVNTLKSWKSLDKKIAEALGGIECMQLTVADCAKPIEALARERKARSGEALRARLIQVCRRGMQLGWMDFNPAEVTGSPSVKVKRGRLTLEIFQAIYAKADEVAPWLSRAMMLGLVLGADRLTITQLQRSNVANGLLTYQRQKTGAWIAVPLGLRMEAVGVSLDDLVSQRGKVLSPYLLHHTRAQGQAAAGDAIHPDTMSEAFTRARKLAGVPDEGAPTFHELRSLCKRTYDAQGGVDTKALLGHAGERVAELYANPRGIEPVKVKVG